MKKVSPRMWCTLILIGLVGQFAWTIENMYFNVFLYNTISTDPGYISAMVGWSAAAATLTTLLMGALSDRVGKRKLFICGGYIPLNGAFCYLSTILDGCTKQVLSYVLSESLEVDFVLETVQKMVHQHGISLKKETILHSDQGCHYTCIKFIQLVKNSSLRQSMSRKGNCWDNAPQESFFGHMKDELAEKIPNWTCFADVQRSIDDWMDYYNNDRYQWDLAKLSPNEYYRYLTTGRYPC